MVGQMRFALSLILLAMVYSPAQAGELSIVKGFYQSEKVRDGLETTNISLGSRYLDSLGGKMSWYADFGFAIKSYSAPSNEPGNQTDVKVGGGVRMAFSPLLEKVIPYISGGAFYKSETGPVTWSAAVTSWTQESGLFYNGAAGLHLPFSNDFFVEVETPLFVSALAGKSVRTSKTPAADTKDEVDRTDLFVSSQGKLIDTTVGLGLKF